MQDSNNVHQTLETEEKSPTKERTKSDFNRTEEKLYQNEGFKMIYTKIILTTTDSSRLKEETRSTDAAAEILRRIERGKKRLSEKP